MYYNARYYDPAIGRFISADTIVDPGAGNMGFNRYMYVAGNPVNYTDPSGHVLTLAVVLIAALIGAVGGGVAGGIQYNLTHSGNNWDFGGFMGAVGAGAALGAIGASVGIVAATGVVIGGAAATIVGGAAGGFASGFVGGAANAWINGASFGDGLVSGLRGGLMGGITGAYMAGITFGVGMLSDASPGYGDFTQEGGDLCQNKCHSSFDSESNVLGGDDEFNARMLKYLDQGNVADATESIANPSAGATGSYSGISKWDAFWLDVKHKFQMMVLEPTDPMQLTVSLVVRLNDFVTPQPQYIPMCDCYTQLMVPPFLPSGPIGNSVNTIRNIFKGMGSLQGGGYLGSARQLIKNGFKFKGNTAGGYQKWYHPSGAKVQIRPDGQIYRTGGGKGFKWDHKGNMNRNLHGQEFIY